MNSVTAALERAAVSYSCRIQKCLTLALQTGIILLGV